MSAIQKNTANYGNPVVSVIVFACKCEKSIAAALDSILAQKTSFPIEILIGAQLSDDSTVDIARDYQSRLPDGIKVFISEQNIGKTKIIYGLQCRAKGRFIAYLDGNDLWCDRHKLQMQADFLLSHTEYIACCHKSMAVDKYGDLLKEQEVRWISEKEIYTAADFKGYCMPAHLSAILHRNIFETPQFDYSVIYKASPSSCDRTIAMLLSAQGNIYRLPYVMSHYRSDSDKSAKASDKNIDFAARFSEKYNYFRMLEKYSNIYFNAMFDFDSYRSELFTEAMDSFFYCPSPDSFAPVKHILSQAKHPMQYIWHYLKLPPKRISACINGMLNKKKVGGK